MPLTASSRATLIGVIAGRLNKRDWTLVQTVLDQFAIKEPKSWNGGYLKDYILQRIKTVSDQVLVELAQYVGYTFDQSQEALLEPLFWRQDMFRLFISHLAAERAYAGDLQRALHEYGISSFVAHNDIEPTTEWQEQIELALGTCEGLVALLQKNFHASYWTDQEIGFAMGRRIPTFAVRLGETPYGFIGRVQAFNGNGKDCSAVARELFDSFRKHKQTQRRMSEVLLALFEKSDSFAQAKQRIGYLEELQLWDASFPDRLRSALQRNSQIDGSYGVPNRVKSLAMKWGETSQNAL